MKDPNLHVYPTAEQWAAAYRSVEKRFVWFSVTTPIRSCTLYVSLPWVHSCLELVLNQEEMNRLNSFLQQVEGLVPPSEVLAEHLPVPQHHSAWIASPVPGLSVAWCMAAERRDGGFAGKDVPVFVTLTQSPERGRNRAQVAPALLAWQREAARILKTL